MTNNGGVIGPDLVTRSATSDFSIRVYASRKAGHLLLVIFFLSIVDGFRSKFFGQEGAFKVLDFKKICNVFGMKVDGKFD